MRGRGTGACTVVATTAGIAVGLVLSGCTGRKSEKVEDKPPPTQLGFELPIGVEVSVDGKAIGRAPLAATDVTPGSHEVKLTTPCAETTVTVDAREATTTTVDLGQAPELMFAKLRVEGKTFEGTLLQPTVRLGEVELGSGSVFDVPACKHRVTIAATQDKGLGAFIEDIEFEPGQTYERKVVLAPGPDMVRIYGGSYTMGPTPQELADWEGNYPNYEAEVETFDIDRTEVTVEQFFRCREAGACPPVPRSISPYDRRYLRDHWHESCGIIVDPDSEPLRSTMRKGHEQRAMNCVAPPEAAAYCAWVGKRLPTDVEWEYAGRGRDSRNAWPWGNAPGTCSRANLFRCTDLPQKPCSYPDDVTQQGLCDMAGNLSELVTEAAVVGRNSEGRGYKSHGANFRDSDLPPFYGSGTTPKHQDVEVGFRCVRDVEPPSSSDEGQR